MTARRRVERQQSEQAMVERVLGFRLVFGQNAPKVLRNTAERQRVFREVTRLAPAVRDDNIREMLYRLLTDKEARPVAFDFAVSEFKRQAPTRRGELLRWVLGAAIATMSNKHDTDVLIGFIENKEYALGRQELVTAVARRGCSSTRLGKWAREPQLRLHTLNGLLRNARKSEEVRSVLIRLAEAKDDGLRREAEKRLARLSGT